MKRTSKLLTVFGRIWRDERGQSELVEFIGLFPIFVGMLLILVQAMDAGHTLFTAMEASREGVRAAVVGDDCGQAVAQVTPGWNETSRRVDCFCDANVCRVNVELRLRSERIPVASRIMRNFWINHASTMRNERPTQPSAFFGG